ncbi:MAG: aminoglycoside phosphotransferase family protein [Ardenticatenaceae bacterium]|nr:aminoglycoside phosphotransferase family protein [Anaerolineales bacterium]MCB9007208.1 aminoglycoside phosphotransferase family protein [Ardenticatenaceae bacterium]
MLEKPDLQDEKIVDCLQKAYGLKIGGVSFLPLGADVNTAVYRITTPDGTPYFLKLRSGDFEKTSILLPKFLSDQGIGQVIAPLTTKTGDLWSGLDRFTAVLYPFVAGQDAYDREMQPHHWQAFGKTLRQIHSVTLPPALAQALPRESFTGQWRDFVKSTLSWLENAQFDDPVMAETAVVLKKEEAVILDLVGRAERLAQLAQTRSLEFVVCHADIHAGNILLTPEDAFYIVDWDTLLLAPKERDLMYLGAGLLGDWLSPREEEACFYAAYGQTPIDFDLLAYYRYERIVQDIASFGEELLTPGGSRIDREQSLHYLKSNFLPNSTIALAYQSDKTTA